ncbi:S-adenosylmethionine:tRNA ribosyltransferase-isomerase [Nonomuraea sp. KC401]|uniref:S-adenosylmethionine:tRNA ribosyltransferase-isomerase n=1 Tax=unclassified Nonomuraea TaxID=2593643 RepID=UPI0010FE454A|nr:MULTISPECIES: S-adenosylmethionine:tRNA ribosyltransferase-isomerase [unclassified Nonomuraea]NBE98822.1 S-adenosylmethionine:tRNA ribosyltransferase-isomerase [Nonomuraea sp. K271]TLF65069.1 S-adenosylmethionine:tRNA ribosyltransferase-isomerase [Nonomuraea sp. KC401]
MTASLTGALDFSLPPGLAAHEPPEARGTARDAVRLMVSRGDLDPGHHRFADLPRLLDPGDLIVVNNSATLPAAVRLDRLAVHFSTAREDGTWLVELRRRTSVASEPYGGGAAGEWLPLPGRATLRLIERETPRLWRAELDRDVNRYLRAHGVPIRYSYVERDWPIEDYQTVFATVPGSAEMPSAARPFTADLVAALVARGIGIAPITLHTGVASPEKDEPPYAERYDVPGPTARLVNLARENGNRVVAAGTTVVRALETAAAGDADGRVAASAGWTRHIVTPEHGVRAVTGLITGLHEPRSSHLLMLSAIAGEHVLARAYEAALRERYLWHEFGDTHLILRN